MVGRRKGRNASSRSAPPLRYGRGQARGPRWRQSPAPDGGPVVGGGGGVGAVPEGGGGGLVHGGSALVAVDGGGGVGVVVVFGGAGFDGELGCEGGLVL